MSRGLFAVVFCLFALVPTAHAKKFTAESTAMRVPAPSTAGQAATILVLENRADVLSGDKKETFEGVSRELYGIPVARETNDHTAMSAYLGQRLRVGFQNAGYAASYVVARKGTAVGDAIQSIEPTAGGLVFVLDMRDWHYDFGGFKPSFLYDVTVSVYDGQKHLMAQKDFGGTELMPTDDHHWMSFKQRYAQLYQTIFDRVFATPDIKLALEGKPSLASVAKGTVEERLERLKAMFDQNLIDAETYEREKQRIVGEL